MHTWRVRRPLLPAQVAELVRRLEMPQLALQGQYLFQPLSALRNLRLAGLGVSTREVESDEQERTLSSSSPRASRSAVVFSCPASSDKVQRQRA